MLDGVFVARASTESEQDVRRFVHELQSLANFADCVLLIGDQGLSFKNNSPVTAGNSGEE